MATKQASASSTKKSDDMPQIPIDFSKVVAASRVYIVEHFVVHLSVVLLAISGIALFNSVMDSIFTVERSVGVTDIYGGPVIVGGVGMEQLIVYLAMALIGLPIFALFYTRTRKAERAHPKLMLSRARRRLIYVTLSILAIVLLGYAIGFVYTSLLALVNASADVRGESWIHSALKQWFALAYLGLISFFVSRLTVGIDEGGKK